MDLNKEYSNRLKKIVLNSLSDYTMGDKWDGSKFFGSLGPVSDWDFVDYWTLRKRSLRLFRTNIYAKGVIRRLLDNEIHTGVIASPTPIGSAIWKNMDDEAREDLVSEWGEKLETEFSLYAGMPSVFDWGKKLTFGAFQELVRFESLVTGDGIIVSRIDNKTGLPRWQWVNGDHIMNPDNYAPDDDGYILHGVEFDRYGKKVAFHVRTEVNGQFYFERIPVRAKKSGRLVSWMVYGSEHFVDDVRGEPFLADSVYMLKDLDRTRDAEVRASLVNAMIPIFFKHSKDAISVPRPSAGVALKGAAVPPAAAGQATMPGGIILPEGYDIEPPTKKIDIWNPGTVADLDSDEDVVSFNTNRPNVNYAVFEKAIVSVLSWSHGIPPEILMLEFNNNYSASRQANNEFVVYLSKFYKSFGETVCQNIYNAFLEQAVLTGQLALPGFMKAYGEATKWRTVSAWEKCAWIGLNRPAVDRLKEVQASEKALDNMLTTFDIEARSVSGLGIDQIIQTQKREIAKMARAGLAPHTREDNNSNPAYPIEGGGTMDEGEFEARVREAVAAVLSERGR